MTPYSSCPKFESLIEMVIVFHDQRCGVQKSHGSIPIFSILKASGNPLHTTKEYVVPLLLCFSCQYSINIDVLKTPPRLNETDSKFGLTGTLR
jgi:hypothetical protein